MINTKKKKKKSSACVWATVGNKNMSLSAMVDELTRLYVIVVAFSSHARIFLREFDDSFPCLHF